MPRINARPVRAVGYVRVSTDEQAKEGVSLDAQRHSIAEYCAREGLDLAEIYCDDGYSGSDPKRPAFVRLMSDLQAAHEAKKPLTLVVWKWNRVTRKQRTLLEVVDALQAWDFGFVSITENIDTTTATGYATMGIMAAVAELFVKQLQECTREGLAQVRREGRRLGRAHFGFRCVTKRGVMLMPDEIRVIEMVFGWYYLDRMTTPQIERMMQLREMGPRFNQEWIINAIHRTPIYRVVVSKAVREAMILRGKKIPVLPEGYIQPFDPKAFDSLTPKDRERTDPMLSVV